MGTVDRRRDFGISPVEASTLPPMPGVDELYAMPGHLIRRVQQVSTAIFAEECGRHELTSVQYAALVAIREHPGVDATRLSQLIAFDRSTLGDVLERLALKALIERDASATDRRVKCLRLTPAGAWLLDRVQPAVRRAQQRLLEPLNAADRETMLRLLAALAEVHNGVAAAPMRAAGRIHTGIRRERRDR